MQSELQGVELERFRGAGLSRGAAQERDAERAQFAARVPTGHRRFLIDDALGGLPVGTFEHRHPGVASKSQIDRFSGRPEIVHVRHMEAIDMYRPL